MGFFFFFSEYKILLLKDIALSKIMGFGEVFGTETQFDLTCATLQAQLSNLRNLTGRYFSPLLTPMITHSSGPISECSPNPYQNTKFIRSTKAVITPGLSQHKN